MGGGSWMCAKCTYENEGSDNSCKVCSTRRAVKRISSWSMGDAQPRRKRRSAGRPPAFPKRKSGRAAARKAFEEAAEAETFTVEKIKQVRIKPPLKVGDKYRIEYLVKWEGFDDAHNSWEPERNFLDRTVIEAFTEANAGLVQKAYDRCDRTAMLGSTKMARATKRARSERLKGAAAEEREAAPPAAPPAPPPASESREARLRRRSLAKVRDLASPRKRRGAAPAAAGAEGRGGAEESGGDEATRERERDEPIAFSAARFPAKVPAKKLNRRARRSAKAASAPPAPSERGGPRPRPVRGAAGAKAAAGPPAGGGSPAGEREGSAARGAEGARVAARRSEAEERGAERAAPSKAAVKPAEPKPARAAELEPAPKAQPRAWPKPEPVLEAPPEPLPEPARSAPPEAAATAAEQGAVRGLLRLLAIDNDVEEERARPAKAVKRRTSHRVKEKQARKLEILRREAAEAERAAARKGKAAKRKRRRRTPEAAPKRTKAFRKGARPLANEGAGEGIPDDGPAEGHPCRPPCGPSPPSIPVSHWPGPLGREFRGPAAFQLCWAVLPTHQLPWPALELSAENVCRDHLIAADVHELALRAIRGNGCLVIFLHMHYLCVVSRGDCADWPHGTEFLRAYEHRDDLRPAMGRLRAAMAEADMWWTVPVERRAQEIRELLKICCTWPPQAAAVRASPDPDPYAERYGAVYGAVRHAHPYGGGAVHEGAAASVPYDARAWAAAHERRQMMPGAGAGAYADVARPAAYASYGVNAMRAGAQQQAYAYPQGWASGAAAVGAYAMVGRGAAPGHLQRPVQGHPVEHGLGPAAVSYEGHAVGAPYWGHHAAEAGGNRFAVRGSAFPYAYAMQGMLQPRS